MTSFMPDLTLNLAIGVWVLANIIGGMLCAKGGRRG